MAFSAQQVDTLKQIASAGSDGVNLSAFDKRTVNSLAKQGFVKVKVTKAQGSWATVTAKGKKQLDN